MSNQFYPLFCFLTHIYQLHYQQIIYLIYFKRFFYWDNFTNHAEDNKQKISFFHFIIQQMKNIHQFLIYGHNILAKLLQLMNVSSVHDEFQMNSMITMYIVLLNTLILNMVYFNLINLKSFIFVFDLLKLL
jgi:hypothetical protein